MFRLLTAVMACVALMTSLSAMPANAEKRVALVIGNDSYEVLRPQLANAAADARDIGRALRDSGFETTVKANVKRRELYQLIDAFGAAIAASPDTVGLFYYAGHGIQANGKNYLIPVVCDGLRGLGWRGLRDRGWYRLRRRCGGLCRCGRWCRRRGRLRWRGWRDHDEVRRRGRGLRRSGRRLRRRSG
jgi:hypothetical protein